MRIHLDLGRLTKKGKAKQCHNAMCAVIRLRAKLTRANSNIQICMQRKEKTQACRKTALSNLASVVIKNEFRSESCISEKYTIRESNQGMVFVNDSYSVKETDIYDPCGYACERSHLDSGRLNKQGKGNNAITQFAQR